MAQLDLRACDFAALAIAVVGLVLAAKASDEKADNATVTQGVAELRADVDDELSGLQALLDELAVAVGELGTDEAAQIDAVAQAFRNLQERVGVIEELHGLDEE